MTRVLVVDDEALVRRGLCRLLELDGGIDVIGEARDGDEALEMIRGLRPDVTLLDVRMPGRSGIDVLRELSEGPDFPPCLVLTTFDDREILLESLRLGARGYLRKDVSLEQLVGAIQAVARGETWFQPAVTESLLKGIGSRASAGSAPVRRAELDPLTSRESEVLRLMAGGLSNKEIALALGIAGGTAKVHVSTILSKLGVRDRTQAVIRALESGIL